MARVDRLSHETTEGAEASERVDSWQGQRKATKRASQIDTWIDDSREELNMDQFYAYEAKTERSEMQEWVEDAFAFKVGDLDYLTDMEIRSRVEIHYDGGLRQFRSDSER